MPPAKPLAWLLAFGLAWASAQAPAQPGAAGEGDGEGWTTPGQPPTQADSLAAFRPDSLPEEAVRAVESAPSPFAAPARLDSADSVASLLRGRKPAISAHFGVNFTDFDARRDFDRDLQARMSRDSLVALQPYESVQLVFPAGLQALLPLGPHFDLAAKSHSYWFRQTAVLGGTGGGTGIREEAYYAVQAHLAGIGLRFYLPSPLLSVTGQLGLYVQGLYYWLLAGELYSSAGSAPARFNPLGSAHEIQVGFRHALVKPWGVTGSLGYMQQRFSSRRPWSSVLAEAAPSGNAKWGSAALQATLSLWYHFGTSAPPPPRPLPRPPQSQEPGATGQDPPPGAPGNPGSLPAPVK